MSRITLAVGLASWTNELERCVSPSAASTAVKASSTGIPAARKAPNASSRIANVIGSESFSAFDSPSETTVFIAFEMLASPTSAIVKPGCAFASLAVASSAGWTRASAVSESPRILKPTSARCPSFDTAPSRTLRTCSVRVSVARAWSSTRRNAGADAVSVCERTSTFSLAVFLT